MSQNQKRKSQEHKSVLYLRNVDIDIKNFFRAWCIKRGFKMNKVIEQLMKETIDSDRKRAELLHNEEIDAKIKLQKKALKERKE